VSGINPSAIPGLDLDPDAVVAAANALANGGGSVRDSGADVVGKWRGLGAHYQAPEASQLFTVMDPVEAAAREFGDAVQQVAVVLRAYADEVRPIKAALTSVRHDAYAFTHKIASNSDWQYDQDLVDENTDLIKRVNAAQIKLWDAERTCANGIRALYCAAPWHAATSDNDPLGYGVSQLPTDAKMPWGTSVDRKDHCPKAAAVDVKRFVWDGVVVDGLWGTVVGIGALVGIQDWSWSVDNFTSAWKGMAGLIGYSAATGSWSWGNAGNTWKGLGKGMLSWDTWKDDPARAAGGAGFNVLSLLIPGVDAATALKTAGKAGEASRAAALLSKGAKIFEFTDPLSLTLKAGKIAIPKLGDLLGGMSDATKGLGDAIKVHDVPTGLDVPKTVDTPPLRDPDHVPVHEPAPAPELVGPDGNPIHTGHDTPGGTGTGGDDLAGPPKNPSNPDHTPVDAPTGGSHSPGTDGPRSDTPSGPDAGHESGTGGPGATGPGASDPGGPPASTGDPVDPPASGGDPAAPPASGDEPGRIAIDESGTPHVVNFSDALLGTKGAMEVHLQAVLDYHHVSRAEFDNLMKTPLENLSRADVDKFIAIDQDMGGVLDDTVLQKVIPPAQALEILDDAAPRFAEPELLARVAPATKIEDILTDLSGFVSRGQDVVGLTPTEVFHDLGLNYPKTTFVDHGESMFAVRYRAGDVSAMPFVPDGPLRAMQSMPDSIYAISNDAARRAAMIDWVKIHDPSSDYYAGKAFDPTNPFRGNGWGGTGDAFSPELTYGTTKVSIPTGAELWRILPDGSQEVAAVYRDKRWFAVAEQPVAVP
jgi:hypothetical protein